MRTSEEIIIKRYLAEELPIKLSTEHGIDRNGISF